MVEAAGDEAAVERLLAHLGARGVHLLPFGPGRLRGVTHMDVDDAGVELVQEALDAWDGG